MQAMLVQGVLLALYRFFQMGIEYIVQLIKFPRGVEINNLIRKGVESN